MAEKPRHFLQGKTIIIAGGGIAGSTFAASLLRLWDAVHDSLPPPTITIIERDSDDTAKQREGYSLSLAGYDETGGLLALKKLGLLEETLDAAVSGTDGAGAFKIWGPDWAERISFTRKPAEGVPSASVRIARREFRRILHRGLDDRVRFLWETQCVAAKGLGGGRVRVDVQQNGVLREMDCDLLVVADGASSKLRSQLRPDDRLEYTGAILRGGLSRFEDQLPAPFSKDWGFALSGDGVSLFVSPVDDKSVVWALGHLEQEPSLTITRDSPTEDAKSVIARARELGTRFQEPFSTMVDHTDLDTIMHLNARDKIPFKHDNLCRMAAVFIGDSNHALSPFAGYGANLALQDGWDLAERLLCGPSSTSLADAVAAYDAVSVPRAAKIVKGSRARLKMGHSTGWRLWLFCLMLAVGRLVGLVLRR